MKNQKKKMAPSAFFFLATFFDEKIVGKKL